MKKYKATLKHDSGQFVITVLASDENTAIQMICDSEGCPPASIIRIRLA